MSRRWTGRWRDPRSGITHSVRLLNEVDRAYLTRIKAACTRASAIKSAWTTSRAVTCLFCLAVPHGPDHDVPPA